MTSMKEQGPKRIEGGICDAIGTNELKPSNRCRFPVNNPLY